MKYKALTVTKAFVFSAMVLANPAVAQGTDVASDPVDALIALVQNDAAQEVLGLPQADLLELLAAASDAQMKELMAAFSPEDGVAVVISMIEAGAEPATISALASAFVETHPDAAANVAEAIVASADPMVLPQIAAGLQNRLSGACGEYPQPVLTAMALTIVSVSLSAVDSLVAVGNSQGGDCAASLAVALAEITETASDLIASSIETALALEGGAMAQLVSLARNEADVAATPDGTGIAAGLATPFVAPGALGGAGAPAQQAFFEARPASAGDLGGVALTPPVATTFSSVSGTGG